MARGRGKATPHDLEAMKHVSGMLQRLLAENNLKQSHLADRLEIPRSSFNEYVKGTALPRPGNVQKIADYFGLKKSDIDPRFKSNRPSASIPLPNFDPRKTILLSNYDKLNDTRKNKLLATSETLLAEEQGKVIDIQEKIAEYDARQRTELPVPGEVSAGTGVYAEDFCDTYSFITDDIPDDYDTIARVKGNSMEPKIHDGDFLFIRITSQVDPNTIGIFQVNGENYVKKLRHDNNGTYYLRSLNTTYADIILAEDDDIRTIGEVVDIYREG